MEGCTRSSGEGVSKLNIESLLQEAVNNRKQHESYQHLKELLPAIIRKSCTSVELRENKVVFYFKDHVILGEVVSFYGSQIKLEASQKGYRHVSFRLIEK